MQNVVLMCMHLDDDKLSSGPIIWMVVYFKLFFFSVDSEQVQCAICDTTIHRENIC